MSFKEQVETINITETYEPQLYKVILHNDDFTTMDFVVMILVEVFHKNLDEATNIMLSVHEKGSGICGIYPFEIAETKVSIVHKKAKEASFPLLCTFEEE